MTGGTLAWGIAFAALCIATGISIGWPLGDRHGRKRAAEDARDDADAAVVAGWKGLPDEDGHPAPPWPPAPPDPPRAGPGKHRHPSGPPKHEALPTAGRLPAEPSPWAATMTLPAPAGSPPWDQPPDRMLHVQGTLRAGDTARIKDAPEPVTEVLEPTAADCLRPDALTDTGWTRQMAADMDRFIAGLIGATDKTLKEITGGTR